MPKMFPMLTYKMEYLLKDIIASLGQLPVEQRTFLFGLADEEDMEWVLGTACYIALEYIKYAYDYDDSEHSLRYFRKGENDTDDERMRQSRITEFVLKYKKREIDLSGIELRPDHKFANVSMNGIESKLKGYRLTEMNYFEHQNIHDLEIIKAIVQNRIGYAKKISNIRFIEIFDQYDKFLEDIIAKSKNSDKEMVFYSIALFTLEWHYPIELLYRIACIMEETDIQEVNKSDLVLLCGNVMIESMYSGWVTTQSRMVKERLILADSLFRKGMPDSEKEELKSLIKELIVLVVHYKESLYCKGNMKYIDWFRTESNVSDWASFFRFYNLCSIWEKKEWTPKRIQNMRKLFYQISLEKL